MEKLSEAVEKKLYDTILPEATPEDFDLNLTAAMSEPFVDARVRNKAAREKFFKTMKEKEDQAKDILNLDDQLKERQANGNGKLVEDINGDAINEIEELFKNLKWQAQDVITEQLKTDLQEIGAFNESNYAETVSFLNEKLGKLFEKASYIYQGKSGKMAESSRSKREVKKTLKEDLKIFSFNDYKPWGGAVHVFEKIQEEGKAEDFFDMLGEIYPDGIDAMTLNDLLWFEPEFVFDLLNIKTEEGEEE